MSTPRPKTASTAAAMFRPGTAGPSDPDHMYETTTTDQIGEWIETLRGQLDIARAFQPASRGRVGAQVKLFSDWQRTFFASVEKQFIEGMAVGRTRPLTGKQLVVLVHMVRSLASDTATHLRQDPGDG